MIRVEAELCSMDALQEQGWMLYQTFVDKAFYCKTQNGRCPKRMMKVNWVSFDSVCHSKSVMVNFMIFGEAGRKL